MEKGLRIRRPSFLSTAHLSRDWEHNRLERNAPSILRTKNVTRQQTWPAEIAHVEYVKRLSIYIGHGVKWHTHTVNGIPVKITVLPHLELLKLAGHDAPRFSLRSALTGTHSACSFIGDVYKARSTQAHNTKSIIAPNLRAITYSALILFHFCD